METELEREPLLTAATIISNVVRDLLYQNKFGYAHFPELVDLAVVITGLGIPQSQIGFVNNSGRFWDSTRWSMFPQPFLDGQAFAFTCAIASWIRHEKDPAWAQDLPSDLRRPMHKSLKYLLKTDDSFFQREGNKNVLEQSQSAWAALALSDSISSQIVAVRHLKPDASAGDQDAALLKRLRSPDPTVLLHSIAATESIDGNCNEATLHLIVEELQILSENREEEIRAKAMCSLARLGQINEQTTQIASKMLDSSTKFVVYSGVIALSALDSVPENVILPANRALIRSLQSCDYEFVGLLVAAFNRWLEDPQTHLETLLQNDSPEYLNISLDALANIREQLVELSS